jgi:NAD(P)-dependent dehydrogenase (short-subunit alcohol dehydrogenase family)
MAVYLITGEAHGTGSGIARQLVAKGGTVIIAGKKTPRVPGARCIMCDIADTGQVASLLMGVEMLEGKLDGLVCPAAHLPLIRAAAPLLRAAPKAEVTITAAAPNEALMALSAALGPTVQVNCQNY